MDPRETAPYQSADRVPQSRIATPAGAWSVATRTEECDPEALQRDLRSVVRGEVRFDALAQTVYSSDASIYQIRPLGVVIPQDEDDLAKVVGVCANHGASMTGRGAGTSLAGQACGHGVVVDVSRHFDRIHAIDLEKNTVRLGPGVVLDHLNAYLEKFDLFFGPDVATSSRATLGGMANNNSSGARSILYGMTLANVERLREVLSDGTILDWGPLTKAELARKRAERTREGDLLSGLIDILEKYRNEIKARFPKVLRKVGGYPLDHLLEQYERLEEDEAATFNPARLFVGSEGTLGLLAELTLNLVPLHRQKNLILLEFDSVGAGLRTVSRLVELKPSAVELVDHNILGRALESPGLKNDVSVLKGSPQAILIVEFLGDDPEELKDRVTQAYAAILERIPEGRPSLLTDPKDQIKVWNIRKAGLGMMMRMKGHTKPCAFIEDAAIPLDRLPDYVAELNGKLAELGLRAGAYAHASVGLLHIRPIIDLYTEAGIKHLRRVAEISVELSQKYGGSFSGEHGDGMARSEFLPKTHGSVLCQAFKEVKHLFDPAGLMNPGRIVDPYPMDRNLRYGEDYSPPSVKTVFSYQEYGSFSDAVDMCSGVGQCRNRMEATMCPSYMATKDEFHTTRARANALRNALNGRIPFPSASNPPTELSWATDEVLQALDLCLSCKACKTECPTGVDMARWKAEALHARHQTHGIPGPARFIANYPAQARLASAFAPISNWLAQRAPVRFLMESLYGLDRRVPPPWFYRETFRKAYRRYSAQAWFQAAQSRSEARPVILFVDTFMNHHQPEVGLAAVRLLSSAGFKVLVVDHKDEGRTALSKGFLDIAKRLAEENVRILGPMAARGIPLVGCEPSSILTFRDEVPELVPGKESAGIAANSWTLAEFLEREIAAGSATLAFQELPGVKKILFHGHCHAKALADARAPVRLLARIPSLEASLIDAGCCGMAGSFGHERAHYEVSRLVGEERLFPAIRGALQGTLVCTEGFSCHHQIGHHVPGTDTRHYAQILADAILG